MKKLIALILALTLVLCLAACAGGNEEGPDKDQTQSTTGNNDNSKPNNDSKPDDSKPSDSVKTPSHTVKIVDEAGNPIADVMVQLCLESCVPAFTDAEGMAYWYDMEDADYKVSVNIMPEGFVCEEEAYYFEDGSNEMTITLKAAE